MADIIKERLATDETLKHLVRGVDAIATALSGTSKTVLDETFAAMLDGENTTVTFHHWWKLAREQDSEADRYETLCRWFAMLGEAWADKFYTLRGPDWRVNSTGNTALTPMGDLATKLAAAGCYTEESEIAAEWCDEDPMTWYVRANATMNDDGTATVAAVEGVDDTFDVTGFLAPVQVFRLALWRTWYTDGTYEYKTFATEPHGAMRPYAANVAPDGTARKCHWMPAFCGSIITKESKTCLTSGVGNTPAWRVSAATGLGYARNMGAYEGLMSDTDIEVLLDQWQLRHWNLENSGIIEGCLNYNYQYAVAAAETGVTRVLLTTAQAANLLPGSWVEVGSNTNANTDRNNATMYDIVNYAKIESIESVTIEGDTYAAVNLELAATVDIPTGAYISTMPWLPGSTEQLPGRKDGSLHSCTDGKSPARIAGVEIIDGAYAIGLDPIWSESYDASRDPKNIYTVYAVRSNANQASSAGANHVEIDTFEYNGTSWAYYKHLRINNEGMLIPEGFGTGTSTTTFMKSAFSFYTGSDVRAPWRFCPLDNGGFGGLAGANGYLTPSGAYWYGRPRLSGAGGMRGEWVA